MILADKWKDYEVIETGDGDKLERWGDFVLLRPDPHLLPEPALSAFFSIFQSLFVPYFHSFASARRSILPPGVVGNTSSLITREGK